MRPDLFFSHKEKSSKCGMFGTDGGIMERMGRQSQLRGSNMREKSHSCCVSKQCLNTLDEALGGGEWLRVRGLDVLAARAFCCRLCTQGETASAVLGLSWS